MIPPFENSYHLRKVADASAKPCAFCLKLTTSVLITKDGTSDFFYTCDSHLKDPHFASPVYDDQYKKTKAEKEALDKEIALLKQKWDEKNRYSWAKFLSMEKKDYSKKDDEKEEENKINDLDAKAKDYTTILNKPARTYQLQKDIYKIRVDKKVKPKTSNYSTSNVKDLSGFPTAPSGAPN